MPVAIAKAQESMIEKKEVKPGVGAHKRGGEASIPNLSAAGEPHLASFWFQHSVYDRSPGLDTGASRPKVHRIARATISVSFMGVYDQGLLERPSNLRVAPAARICS